MSIDAHNTHVELHKMWAKSILEKPIWINRPDTFWSKLVFRLFRYPKPVYQTLEDLQKQFNEHISACSGLNEVLCGPPPVAIGYIKPT